MIYIFALISFLFQYAFYNYHTQLVLLSIDRTIHLFLSLMSLIHPTHWFLLFLLLNMCLLLLHLYFQFFFLLARKDYFHVPLSLLKSYIGSIFQLLTIYYLLNLLQIY